MRRWPLLVLVLAPLLPLWPGLTGFALGPFDAIRHLAPWNGPKPAQPWDVLMADSVLQSHVWRTMVLDAWGKGQLPLWNPYEFAGTPLLANSQSGGFYPPHIALGLLHVPAGVAGFLLAWFHLALAGAGTYALVRRLGGSVAGGLTGGLGFVLSPFLLGWAPLSSVPATVSWIPLALACVVDLSRPGWVAHAPFESRYHAFDPRTLAALAACVGMMLLAGHLQFAAYGLMAIIGVALLALPLSWPRVEASEVQGVPSGDERGPGGEQASPSPLPPAPFPTRVTWRGGAAIVLALVLGVGLAAPQLLPVLSYSKESHRRNAPTEEGYGAYVGSALRLFELATLGHPMALGNPREPIDVGGQTISTYWPAVARRGANFAESAVSLGPVVLALLFAVPWRRRETWPLAGLGLFALLLALGTPLGRLLYFLVPGWSSTGSPARVEVLFVLAACALAGLAVDGMGERPMQIRAAAGAILGLILALVLPSLASVDSTSAILRGAATAAVLPMALLATVLTVVGLFLARRSLLTVPTLVAVIACLTHAPWLVPFGEPLAPPKGDPNIRIAVVNDNWDTLTAQPAVLPPNLAALGGLHELSGYDSLTSRDAVEMLRTVNGGIDPAPPANGNMMFVKPSVDAKALAECGVSEVWSREPLPQLGLPEERDGYMVYKIDGTGRVSGGTVIDGYDRQEVVAVETPSRHQRRSVIIRDRLTPGWGTPMSSSSHLIPYGSTPWREFQTDDHGTLVYRPPGFWSGLAVGDLGWLILIGITITSWRASKRTRSV